MRLHAALTSDEYNEIPGVLVNGWSGSWKKYLFSLMYHNDWYLLYPGYKQVSRSAGLSQQSSFIFDDRSGLRLGHFVISSLPMPLMMGVGKTPQNIAVKGVERESIVKRSCHVPSRISGKVPAPTVDVPSYTVYGMVWRYLTPYRGTRKLLKLPIKKPIK